MPWSKTAQMIPLPRTKGPPELKIRNISKWHLMNSLVQIQNDFTEMFPMIPYTKIDQNVKLG